jgi:mono/diheme cytochrome c family protein
MKLDATRGLLAALCALLALAGCRLPFISGRDPDPVTLAAPPVSQLGSPDLAHTSQWDAGRVIYVGQCVQCHKPKPIQDFAIDKWKADILPVMSARAKLSHEQTESLNAYIMAVKRFQLLGVPRAKTDPAARPITAADNR